MTRRGIRNFRQFMTRWTTSLAALSTVIGLAAPAARAQQYPVPATSEAIPPAPPVLVAPPPGPGAPPTPLPALAFPSFANGLQFIAYPYLWLAGLNMAITMPLQRAPQVNVSIDPGEILGDLNNVPFMGAAELRYGPFGVLADALHIPLGVPVTTRNIFFRAAMPEWDCRRIGGQAATGIGGDGSLAGWNFCPWLEPSVPL